MILPTDAASQGPTPIRPPHAPHAAEVQAALCEILAAGLKLRLGEIDPSAPFLEMGASSLVLVDTFRAVHERFGVRPSLRRVFEEHGTVEKLSAHVVELMARSAADAASHRLTEDQPGEALPLTGAQRQPWYLGRYSDAAAAAHTEVTGLQLDGALDRAHLRAALDRVLQRHEALRLHFSPAEEGQAIAARAEARLEEIDLSGLGEAEQRERIGAWLRHEQERAFGGEDLPVRVGVASLGPGRSLLGVASAGVALDRDAVALLLAELAAVYRELAGGPAADLPPAASYRQFVAQSLAGDAADAEAAAAFWRAQLGDGIPPFSLPTDRPRPPVKSYRGARVVTVIGEALTRELRALSQASGGSLYVTLMGAYALLLSRLSGQDDLVIGTEGRCHDGGAARLIAGRVNPVALRIHIDRRAPVSALLASLRDRLVAVYDHQAYPFADLIRLLDPARDQSRSPIFGASFVMEAAREPPRFEGLEARAFVAPIAFTRYDLELRVTYADDGIQIACDYSTDLLDAATVRRWLANYRAVLERLPSRSGDPAGAFDVLSGDERRLLLEEWRGSPQAYPTGHTTVDLVEAQVDRTPDALALIDGVERVSYRELDQRSNRLARLLRARGAGRGALVGICMSRGADLVVAVLAALKAGAAYVPLDPAYPAERIAMVLDDAEIAVVLTQSHLLGLMPEGSPRAVVAVDERRAEIEREPDGRVGDGAGEQDLSHVIYTSGSTGRPKGVAIEHRSVVNFLEWARGAFDARERAGVLFSTSICFDLSVFELLLPLSTGGRVIVADTALSLPDLPARAEVTLINTVPSAMRELLRAGGVPEGVEVVNLAGEALHADLVQQIYAQTRAKRVVNLYGPTEVTTYATFDVLPRDPDAVVTIGRPVANITVSVLDDAMAPVPLGAVGELYLGGVGLARGYLGRPELTRERFVPDPFSDDPGARLYRTGDLVRFRPDGRLLYLGRADDQVKIRGHRIELGEIECCLREHPRVADAVVTARDDARGDRSLVAYLVVAGGDAPSAGDLNASLGQHLPEYMIPGRYVLLDALPRLPNGKVDRRSLPDPSGERRAAPATAYVGPEGPTEHLLADLWAEILGAERVGVHDNFFELGGHSLLLTTLIRRMWQTFGERLSMRQFFARPTVAGMATALSELRERRAGSSGVEAGAYDQASPVVRARFDFLRRQAELPDDLCWKGDPGFRAADPEVILMTGATGFVGAHLVAELLGQSRARLWALVRAASPEEGLDRIRRGMERYDLWRPGFEGRIVAFPGDLAAGRLGLGDAAYAELAGAADVIVHNAAQVNFIYPYEALEAVNVAATREIIRFAFTRRLKPVHYISSIAVLPMGAQRRFEEENSLDHGLELNMAYDETKWVSEVMLRNARGRGLPATIYRPGEVAGHSRTGVTVPEHFMYAIIAGSLQLGLMPRVGCFVDFTPVDYVASAIAHLALDPRSVGKTFHVTNPAPMHSSRAFDWLHSAGYRFDLLDFATWRDRLMHSESFRSNAIYPFASVLDDFHEVNFEFPEFDCRQTLAALEGSGITCPPVTESLLDMYMAFFVREGAWPEPPRAPSNASREGAR